MHPHNGHRNRLRKRFRAEGLDGFNDHNALELLLFYAIPRQDVNPIAHELISRFGSFANVCDASAEELMKVNGIGESAALFLKLIPSASRYYGVSKLKNERFVSTIEEAGSYLLPRFIGLRNEAVYLMCLDVKGKILDCRMVFEGSVNSAAISIRKIVETALAFNSTSVIIAHNHVSGIALPSKEDEVTTRRLRDALSAVGIKLVDHIIIAEDDYVSMVSDGFFSS